MPLSSKDTQTYRSDAKSGGTQLSAGEREELVKPYLPAPEPEKHDRKDANSRFGIRRFLKNQLHLLLFTILHFFFSVYIHTRKACHVVTGRIRSIFFYHHRSPAMIQKDVRRLDRLPKHLGVILKLEDDGKGGAELERLVNEVAEVSAWCASAGIPQLTIYEKTGILKQYLVEAHRAISQNLRSYFGRPHPTVTLCAPHVQSIESPASAEGSPGHLIVRLISAEDGRDSMVDLTKTLAEMVQRSKISPADISQELVGAELTESIMEETDLLILFSPHMTFHGYPPWQLHLTEVFHVPDNESVGYQVFYSALCKYANAQFRWGR